MTITRILRLADGAALETDFGNGRPIPTVVTRRGEWTEFAASPDVGAGVLPWDALLGNGRMRGMARLTIDRDRWRVRGELRSATAASIDQMRRSFREASHVLAGEPEKRKPESAVDEATWDSWTTAIASAGWTVSARAAQRFVVDLDVRDGFWQATGEPRGRRPGLAVAIGKGEWTEPDCRLAVSRYLLAATDAVRLVRATHTAGRGLALEGTLPGGIGQADLDGTLSALALACQLVGREVNALNDARFARRYLDSTLTKERLCEWTTMAEFSCSK